MATRNSGQAWTISSMRLACSADLPAPAIAGFAKAGAKPWAAKGGYRARLSVGLVTLFLAAIPCTNWAASRYASLDGTNDAVGGYTTWSGAATNIHWAVGVAQAGETIWVSNGVFNLTNNLFLTNACTLRGFNGRDQAVINGQRNGTNGWNITMRGNAIFDGLTMSNGYSSDATYGSGIFINSGGGHIRNSKITGCTRGVASSYNYASITNCIITQNDFSGNGGGIYIQAGFDSAQTFYVNDCVIANNTSSAGGGGVYINSYSVGPAKNVIFSNCIISNNTAGAGGYGGGAYLLNCGIFRNCLIKNNQALNSGGGLYIVDLQKYDTNFGQMVNCTIAGNYAPSGGGIFLNGTGTNNVNSLINCIVYSNFTTSAYTMPADMRMSATDTNAFLYSCVTNALPADRYSITSNPVFTDFAGGNYRLKAISPGVNTGTNQNWMTNTFDLDGRMRIRYVTVDMGAYENMRAGTIFTGR